MTEDPISDDRRAMLAALGLGSALMVPGRGVARPRPAAPMDWATAPVLPLWPGEPPGGGHDAPLPPPAAVAATFLRGVARPELRVFRPQRGNGAAVLVIPGGSYAVVSIGNEGVEVARRLCAAGFTVFVLVYRLPGEGWRPRADVPLIDAQRAMRLIRSRAGAYRLDPQRIAALGFSAGGHLAVSLATGFAEVLQAPRDAIDRFDARPCAAGLVYPVVTLAPPYAHAGSAALLLGPDPDAALIARRSPDRHVTAATPPLFLVHALDDRAVPYRNSVLMLDAATAAGRPVEAHFFPAGGHGFGLGKSGTRVAEWPSLFTGWLAAAMPG